MPIPQHVPISEVASKLACSEDTVRRMIRSGRLPAIRLNGGYRVDEASVLALALTQSHVKKPGK